MPPPPWSSPAATATRKTRRMARARARATTARRALVSSGGRDAATLGASHTRGHSHRRSRSVRTNGRESVSFYWCRVARSCFDGSTGRADAGDAPAAAAGQDESDSDDEARPHAGTRVDVLHASMRAAGSHDGRAGAHEGRAERCAASADHALLQQGALRPRARGAATWQTRIAYECTAAVRPRGSVDCTGAAGSRWYAVEELARAHCPACAHRPIGGHAGARRLPGARRQGVRHRPGRSGRWARRRAGAACWCATAHSSPQRSPGASRAQTSPTTSTTVSQVRVPLFAACVRSS
jgi:hypothetical protein